MQETSEKKRWHELTSQQHDLVFIAFAIEWKLTNGDDRYLMIKAFRDVEPDMIIGTQDGRPFMRIAPEYQDRMTRVLKLYLNPHKPNA